MADEEATNESQPDASAEDQSQDTSAEAPESDATATEAETEGADNAPDGEAGSEAEDEAAPAMSAAEQLASAALEAARSAVASLDDPEPEQTAQSEPETAQASPVGAAQASGESGSLTGSMMGSGVAPRPTPFTPEQLTQLAAVQGGEGIDILADVDLNVKIELGRTKMLVEDVLKLSDGAVVELDKLAGDPVDIYVNERHVARGEVLILNDNFCVRVSEILEATIEDR